MPWHAPVCLMGHPCKFERPTPFSEGRRATIKAHPATPHHSRPYGKNEDPIRICLIIGYSGFSIIVVWVANLMFSLYRRGCFAASSKNKNALVSQSGS